MSAWPSVRHDDVEAARRLVLDTLGMRDSWPEEQLVDVTGLSPKRFQTVITLLLSEGLVHRQPPLSPERPYTAYHVSSSHVASVLSDDEIADLPSEALAVLAHLAQRADTARRISSKLSLSLDETGRVLALLQRHHLVTCRYVGLLSIYHRAS
ncbi:hypothetical protein [Deinococcus yavapaiensis]|uniref:Uncharacterized protein n=1 Tax=Deinococcus yavapaiensis KR-236 TaxID=694435 RepID=A0A318S4Z7_9DEIO|nr:hypothetical protein [Deinococcus yavapaiensis]PYE52773.1 hypothetical protein DES52_11294 [Deinococcus yavapaiensis KR-236]